ncbi:Ribose import ATP-binding protein RbsA [bioreactor metagenome]|uniref:Ribose import ATP-binding protein RbsA n=1 Tax=bioreactor metagenome TaxID=1076179 RepID=A0A645ITP2_9ZZZZ
MKNKLGLLPEDRKQQGVLLSQSIRINTTLSSLRKVEKAPGWIDKKKDISVTEQILKQLSTKYGSMEDDVSSLSGGNQQKVALAKWLAADCECIILDEPTRGVDVGAKVEIYKNINVLAAQGTAIIMISSEMEEIIGMCDRAIIMRQGRVVGELQKDELSENNLINLAMGV